jgi:hypothetical protein
MYTKSREFTAYLQYVSTDVHGMGAFGHVQLFQNLQNKRAEVHPKFSDQLIEALINRG